jgi:predicted transcriptional regulator
MAIDTRKILHAAFDKHTKNVDNYNHNGSTWLIFTDEKKWVIELTKEGTLWYNYYFFQNIMKLLSLEVVENQHYITEWVEDNIISKVKKTRRNGDSMNTETEDAIEDGVKQTKRSYEGSRKQRTKDTIQNGVKSTEGSQQDKQWFVEDTVINGVKDTHLGGKDRKIGEIKDIIENGVKDTKGCPFPIRPSVEDTIQNGVKYTRLVKNKNQTFVEDTIQNGVKETELHKGVRPNAVGEAIQNGVKYTGDRQGNYNLVVEDTIQNGVKKTYSDKIPHEYDWSNQFTEEIDDIIQNGVKHTEKSLQIDGSCVIEDVIKEGVKHTEYGDWLDGDERLDDIIENGIKETTPGGYLGSVEMKGKTVHQFEHAKQDNDVEDVIKSGIKATTTNLPLSQDDGQITEIEDVIRNGVKKTVAGALFDEESKMNAVISEGIKETHDDVMHHTGRVKGVIKNGVKECIPARHPLYNPMDFSVQYRENHRLDDVASVLEKGIKEVQPLPSQEGNMDWGDYYYRQADRTKSHIKYVDDAIRNGIKETWGYEKQPQKRIDEVIMNGQKD